MSSLVYNAISQENSEKWLCGGVRPRTTIFSIIDGKELLHHPGVQFVHVKDNWVALALGSGFADDGRYFWFFFYSLHQDANV